LLYEVFVIILENSGEPDGFIPLVRDYLKANKRWDKSKRVYDPTKKKEAT